MGVVWQTLLVFRLYIACRIWFDCGVFGLDCGFGYCMWVYCVVIVVRFTSFYCRFAI